MKYNIPRMSGKTFALDRHLRGWGKVTVIRKEGALLWVRDEQDGDEYPVNPRDLASVATMESIQKNDAKRRAK